MNSILIIDDEYEICESIKMILEYEEHEVEYSTDPIKGLELLAKKNFEVLLLDIQMPQMSGFEILNTIKEKKIDINVIIITAHSSIENAIKATKAGAFDFLEKPIDRDKLLLSLRNALSNTKLKSENKKLKNYINESENILGNSQAIKNILETISRVAKTDARVLVTGENGTGKELVAREIHRQSNRGTSELIEVNCAAIPNELIESELFGHERGSFTGASSQRIGKFELANRSTLFLDEIGDMSQSAQAKVLRAIEDGKIERVGGNKKIDVDVRIISATNKDLTLAIEEGNFREDLFHRLNVIQIHVPPLRERIEDIPILVEFFVKQICDKNKLPIVKFNSSALSALQQMSWSGNIRELRNIIERIIIMIPKSEISDSDVLSLTISKKTENQNIFDYGNSFQEFKEKAEKSFILKQLEINNWNISRTAEILEIQRSHLYNKMKKYGIENKGK